MTRKAGLLLSLFFFASCGTEVVLHDDPYDHTYRYEEKDGRFWYVEFEGNSVARLSYFPPMRLDTAPSGPLFPYFSTEVTVRSRSSLTFSLASTSPNNGVFEQTRSDDLRSDVPFDSVTYRTQYYRLTLYYDNQATSVTLESH